jgi:Spy/CpxP family protein refolding chaperone
MALVLTCASAAAGEGRDQRQDKSQGVSDKSQGASSVNKDQKDKPVAAAIPRPEDRERWKWWLYDRAELGISDQQSRDINQIFESNIPKLRETRQEMDRAEEELSRTIKEHKADIAQISLLVDRLESARSQNSKIRTLMLYRMHLLLSAEQRAKLEIVRARQEAARRERDKEPPQGRRRNF